MEDKGNDPRKASSHPFPIDDSGDGRVEHLILGQQADRPADP